ncbi:MAG: MarR family transcriptional regulator [Deltaproteobacteria bacterium]|nr:MarR family transcriptional regulator [Deltaproteobacteria bacterium]
MTRQTGIETWIWANILVLFRELDPPELFQEYGLKQTEFDTLTQLFLSDRPLIQSELKKRLLTTKGSVSQMLAKMEKKGFVLREGDTKDRRCQLVTLTPKGRDFLEPIFERHVTRIKKFFSPLTDLEKEILLNILKKVRKARS